MKFSRKLFKICITYCSLLYESSILTFRIQNLNDKLHEMQMKLWLVEYWNMRQKTFLQEFIQFCYPKPPSHLIPFSGITWNFGVLSSVCLRGGEKRVLVSYKKCCSSGRMGCCCINTISLNTGCYGDDDGSASWGLAFWHPNSESAPWHTAHLPLLFILFFPFSTWY